MLPKHLFRPNRTNPNWITRRVPADEDGCDWLDVHDDLCELATTTSDKAMAYRRNFYAHLNVARYVGIAECLQIIKGGGTPAEQIARIQDLLDDILVKSSEAAETD